MQGSSLVHEIAQIVWAHQPSTDIVSFFVCGRLASRELLKFDAPDLRRHEQLSEDRDALRPKLLGFAFRTRSVQGCIETIKKLLI